MTGRYKPSFLSGLPNLILTKRLVDALSAVSLRPGKSGNMIKIIDTDINPVMLNGHGKNR